MNPPITPLGPRRGADDFWSTTPTRDLYCLMATWDIFQPSESSRFLLTIRNELRRRGEPLDGPGCACAHGRGPCAFDEGSTS
ncbi:MAG: hypothetical protein AB7W59_01865 [Acidimicrobiia bacterium]